MARVSIVIPVYNGAATVAHAVDSALGQRFDPGFDVIVVDDGSTDATAATLAGFGDRIRVMTQGNRGPAAARNSGVAIARGEYLAFLDADDVFLPGKLAATAPLLDDLSAVLVFHDAVVVDASGIEVASS